MKPFLPALFVGLAFGLPPAQAAAQLGCEVCHGELELLRQHVPSLQAARSLQISAADIDASAHAGIGCAQCHEGYTRFPHADRGTTRECSSCHAAAASVWADGIHADDGNAECASCHGVHLVRRAVELRTRAGALAMRSACATCHFEPRIPDHDPHADSVSCSGCHEPHRTRPASDPGATVHATNQAATCGACHESPGTSASVDTHAAAVARWLADPAPGADGGLTEPPSCSACHGAHGMADPHSEDGKRAIAERCSTCHEHYAESFADSYHGQATQLGSPAAATCDDCHAPHAIYPAADERSSVSDARRLETCQTCHPGATAGFARFQPHADHHDKEKYPYVYWSFRLMTGLLVGTFAFFGLHSALWLVRSGLDRLAPAGEKDVSHDA